jgi:hypothetical protein
LLTEAFLAGGATVLAVFVLHRLWLGALPRTVCPDCGEATVGVSHPLSARLDRWVRRRWCSACGWAGWGRNGPVLWPKHGPVSHDSGFRWGADRLSRNHGFRWAGPVPAPKPAAPRQPAHPSGFHWGGEEVGTVTDTVCEQAPALPSGFRFRALEPQPPAPSPAKAHRSGFRWSDGEPTSRAPGASANFRWKS